MAAMQCAQCDRIPQRETPRRDAFENLPETFAGSSQELLLAVSQKIYRDHFGKLFRKLSGKLYKYVFSRKSFRELFKKVVRKLSRELSKAL